MHCELCRKEASNLISLALPREDSKFNTRTCIPCAEGTRYYCKVHECAHHTFIGPTHACLLCIRAHIETYGQRETAALITRLSSRLNESARKALADWADTGISIEGVFVDRSWIILRAIVTYAMSHGISEQDVVKMVVEQQNVGCLFAALTLLTDQVPA